MNLQLQVVGAGYGFVAQHMVYVAMRVQQKHRLQVIFGNKLLQFGNFLLCITARIYNGALVRAVVHYVGIFRERIKSKRFYLHTTQNSGLRAPKNGARQHMRLQITKYRAVVCTLCP